MDLGTATMTMFTDSIDCLLSKTYHGDQVPAKFQRVFAADKIPLPLHEFPAAFVANTDPTGEPGEHWVACFQKARFSPLEFFDSYGQDPSRFSLDLRPPIEKSNKQLQSHNTDVCGHYCVYFLLHRPYSPSFTSTLNHMFHLAYNSHDRDEYVYKRINNMRFYERCPEISKAQDHSQCCVQFIQHRGRTECMH